MATEVVKLVTGVGELLLGRVITVDALTGRSREIAYEAIADALAITSLIDYERFCGLEPAGDADQAGAAGDAAHEASAPARLAPAELLARLRRGERLRLVDVREPVEAERWSIRGSELFPLGEVAAGRGPELDDAPIVVYCERDPRSRRAARLLLERGHADVAYLAGGIEGFSAVADDLVSR